MEDSKIKKILLDGEYVTKEELKKAEKYAKLHSTTVVDYFFAEKIISKNILGQAIAESYSVPFADLKKIRIDNEVFKLIPELVAKSKKIIAIDEKPKGLRVGMTSPGDLEIIHLIEKKTGKKVLPHYVFDSDLKNSLLLYEKGVQAKFDSILTELKAPDLSREERDEITVEMVDTLLRYGYQNKASDIHVEPYLDKMAVRFRVDGVMHDVLNLPKELSDLVITRIKILAKMRTDEHRAAQDGKLRFKTEEEMVDVRVSIVPVTEGENVVMRLLAAKTRKFDLPSIGFLENDLKKVRSAIKNPHGMILVTGPTGSGKTTTLYAILQILNKRDIHVSTIEDPVEYDVEGVSQIQVNKKTDITFATGLRSIVRQDPDIIMVGEIRDEETAGIAVNSALTGHLVLSTLHTNDAPTALPRLLDMKVEPFLVASTIRVIIAQRLVRKICDSCKVSYKIDDKTKKTIQNNLKIKEILKSGGKNLDKVNLYKGGGCKICNHTGYDGRVGVFEVLEMADNIKDLILANASSDAIMKVAKENGMTIMFEDGMDKVLGGVTTFEEVMRVARAE